MGGKRRRQETAEESDLPDQGVPIQSKEIVEPKKNLVALHRARFLEWNPSACVASCATDDGTILAVARESGSIELWETDHWACLTTLIGSKDLATTSLAWLQEPSTGKWRLFSGGLDGSLVEWDIPARRVRHRGDAMGGAVWAMAPQPPSPEGAGQKLAVACDDGCLRLFRAEDGAEGLVYDSCLPPLDSRLLSVAWHPNGNVVCTGTSKGTLHAWDSSSKREILRIQTGDEEQNSADVWAVAVLKDGTMVTGDGRGNVQFWDAVHGALVSGIQHHKADVLCLAAAPDGDTVFASGADLQVAIFRKVHAGEGQPVRWEYLDAKRPHTHDVRCMCVIQLEESGAVLISGGNDAQLFAYRIPHFTREHPIRLTKAPQAPEIHIAAHMQHGAAPVVMSVQHEVCSLWQLSKDGLSTADQGNHKEGQKIRVSGSPYELARLSTPSRGHIVASALSPDGSLAFISDADDSALFQIEHQESSSQVQPLSLTALPKDPVVAAVIVGDKLLIASSSGKISIIDVLKDEKVGVLTSKPSILRKGPRLAATQVTQNVLKLIASSDSAFAAVMRPSELQILNSETGNFSGTLAMQKGAAAISVASFGPDGNTLAIGLVDNTLLLYDTSTRHQVEMPETLKQVLSQKLVKMPGSLLGISFIPNKQRSAAFLATSSCLLFVDFRAPATPTSPALAALKARRFRKPNGERIPQPKDEAGSNARLVELDDVCLTCAFTSQHSLVLVSKDWDTIQEQFPAPVYRHRFGS